MRSQTAVSTCVLAGPARSAPVALPAHAPADRVPFGAVALLALLAASVAACGGPEVSDDLLDPAGVAVVAAGADPAAAKAPGSSTSAAPGLAVSASTVAGGGRIDVTYTLPSSVGSGSGAVSVYLGFSSTALAGPKVLRIPAGQRSATFSLHANPWLAAPVATTLTASTRNPQPATFFSQPLSVIPSAAPPAGAAPVVAAVVVSPGTVRSGTGATGLLTLTGPAPATGAAVQVSITNDPLSLDAQVPAVVVVPAGATSATFTIATHLSPSSGAGATEQVAANLYATGFGIGALTVVP